MEIPTIKIEIDDALRIEYDQVKYQRDFLLMLILDEEEFGEGAYERALEKVKIWQETQTP